MNYLRVNIKPSQSWRFTAAQGHFISQWLFTNFRFGNGRRALSLKEHENWHSHFRASYYNLLLIHSTMIEVATISLSNLKLITDGQAVGEAYFEAVRHTLIRSLNLGLPSGLVTNKNTNVFKHISMHAFILILLILK
jgi:hypothetical protein